jgi:hypothetical protein
MTDHGVPSCVRHFHHYLRQHSAMRQRSAPRLLLAHDQAYRSLARSLAEGLGAVAAAGEAALCVTVVGVEELGRDALIARLDEADLFAFFYDSHTRPDADPRGAPHVRDIKDYLKDHWKRSVLFIDIKDHFPEIYATPPSTIAGLNRWVIEEAGRARTMRVTSRAGTELTVDLSRAKPWTDIDGVSCPDLIPGEVATASPGIDGVVRFQGTLLSLLPFAIKHGLVEEQPIELVIQGRKVERVGCANRRLLADLEYFFGRSEANRVVEEVGIGTNLGVRRLYALNSAFEERHCGLHLGLGGAEPGSHHLDLVFGDSRITFDDRLVFDGEFHPSRLSPAGGCG